MSIYKVVGCSKCRELQIVTAEKWFKCRNDSCRARMPMQGRRVLYESDNPQYAQNVINALKTDKDLRAKLKI